MKIMRQDKVVVGKERTCRFVIVICISHHPMIAHMVFCMLYFLDVALRDNIYHCVHILPKLRISYQIPHQAIFFSLPQKAMVLSGMCGFGLQGIISPYKQELNSTWTLMIIDLSCFCFHLQSIHCTF